MSAGLINHPEQAVVKRCHIGIRPFSWLPQEVKGLFQTQTRGLSLMNEAKPRQRQRQERRDLIIGSGLGRQIATGQRELVEISSRLIAATRPARATEDLPLPEEPTMARKRLTGFPSVAGRTAFKSH